METLTQPINLNEEFASLYNENLKNLQTGTANLINDIRQDAFEHFQKLGIPTKKDEDYKYTNIQSLFSPDLKKHFEPRKISFKIDDIFKCDIPELDTHVIILLNGFYFEQAQPIKKLPGNIIAGSLAAASFKYPEIFKKHYAKYASYNNNGLSALNTAFAQDGLFLYLPENSKTDKPVQIINLLLSDEPLFTQPRSLIVADPGSEIKIVVCDHTLCEQKFLSNIVTEIYAGENANVRVTRMQNEHNASAQISNVFVQQEKNSHVTTNTITLHGGAVRNNLNVMLNGEGSENNSFGLYLTDKKQHVDNFTSIIHAKPHCLSNQLYKGVLDDNSNGVFTGKIHVMPDAQKTLAYQKNSNLLLTDNAKMRTKPQLEIYADDVKCSHGATVGQLDENAMFYLRSRGIGKSEAKFLLMYAFAYEILGNIKVEPLRDRIVHLVDKRLRGELSRCHNCAMHQHHN